MRKIIAELVTDSPFFVVFALTFSLLWGWLIASPGIVFPDEYPLPIPQEVEQTLLTRSHCRVRSPVL